MLVETTFGLSVVTAVREASSVDGGGTREESSISTILTARPASLSPSTHQYHPDWVGNTPWRTLNWIETGESFGWDLVPISRNMVDCQTGSWQQSLAVVGQEPTATGRWSLPGGKQGRMPGDRRASAAVQQSPSCWHGTLLPRILPRPDKTTMKKVTLALQFWSTLVCFQK